MPSTFAEDLSPTEFEDIHEYPVATATHKAVEVYERLVAQNPDDPPDLVIGADGVRSKARQLVLVSASSPMPGPLSPPAY